MNKTLLILAHGSRAQATTKVIHEVRNSIAKKNLYTDVRVAFMEFNKPNISEAIQDICQSGPVEVVAVPMFLFEGNHILHDIPEELKKAKEEHPELKITLAKPIGFDERIVDILLERAEGELCQI